MNQTAYYVNTKITTRTDTCGPYRKFYLHELTLLSLGLLANTDKTQTVTKRYVAWSNFIPMPLVLGGPREAQTEWKYPGTVTAWSNTSWEASSSSAVKKYSASYVVRKLTAMFTQAPTLVPRPTVNSPLHTPPLNFLTPTSRTSKNSLWTFFFSI